MNGFGLTIIIIIVGTLLNASCSKSGPPSGYSPLFGGSDNVIERWTINTIGLEQFGNIKPFLARVVRIDYVSCVLKSEEASKLKLPTGTNILYSITIMKEDGEKLCITDFSHSPEELRVIKALEVGKPYLFPKAITVPSRTL